MRGRWWFRLLLTAAVAGAGWVSNALSTAACQRNAAFWFCHVLSAGQPFYLQLQPGQEAEHQAFDAVAAPYTLLTERDGDAYPRVAVATRSPIPFLIFVHFHY